MYITYITHIFNPFFRFMRLWQIIEGSRQTVGVQRIGNSTIIAIPWFGDTPQASEWRIKAGNESAVVIIDYVRLVVVGTSKCSNICHSFVFWVTLNNASDYRTNSLTTLGTKVAENGDKLYPKL